MATSTTKFKIKGLKELEKALKDLPKEITTKIYQDANVKALETVIVPAVRTAMGNYSENTKKGVMVKTIPDDPTGAWGGVSSDSFWVQWADLGTKERYTQKGAYRGAISGAKRIQPAIWGSVENIVDEVQPQIEKAIKDYFLSKGAENK